MFSAVMIWFVFGVAMSLHQALGFRQFIFGTLGSITLLATDLFPVAPFSFFFAC